LKIGIIGYGYVGRAMAKFLETRHKVVVKDIYNGYGDIDTCDFAIVCVPTPMKEDGTCDTSIVEKVVSQCALERLLIKSTVPPGTTKMLAKKYGKKLVFSPEYIGEGNYPIPFWKYPHPTEMQYHDFCIFGGDPADTSYMVDAFKNSFGPQCRFFQLSATAAEIVKYMENAWLATKITFCNEFSDIAKAMGEDYSMIREAWLADGRIERSHTVVNNGFDGKCLPKDLSGIVEAGHAIGVPLEVLTAVRESNKRRIGK
jgi:nucleotide sugar dehydrogenase